MAKIDDLNRITIEYMKPAITRFTDWLTEHAGHDPRECDECLRWVCEANMMGEVEDGD